MKRMTKTFLQTLYALSGGLLLMQGAIAQVTGVALYEPPVLDPQKAQALISMAPTSTVSSAAGIASSKIVSSQRYSSFLTRERTAMAQVADAHLDFYPTDEYLRILPSTGRPAVVAAPFRAKLKTENTSATTPGIPTPTLGRLYRTDSSLASVAGWYSKEYGFDFKYSRSTINDGDDTVTVARAVKPIGNTVVTVMIWNPTSNAQGRRSKDLSFSKKTSVEVQERAFRPRGELVVEGPDAIVELTWKVPYRDLIQKVSFKYQIDPHLMAALVQQESAFNPNAISVDSAMGLTQMIPGTAAMMGVTDPTNPRQALEGGAKYLKMLLRRFKGNVELALAGYNAGPGNVDKYDGIPPFPETRDYVRRIMARYKEKAGGPAAANAKVIIQKKKG